VFVGDDKISGETVDIGVDGISICCETPLHIDLVYRILILPPNHQIIYATGKVVWSNLYGVDENDATVGMGICFIETSDNDREFFNDMISTHLK
jgi:hypothetical protein